MQQTACYDKYMEHGVHIALLLPHAVKNRADGVAYSAEEEESDSPFADDRHKLRQNGDYAPPEGNVKDHAEHLIFFEVYSRERDAECGKSPYYAKVRPAERRVIFSQRTKRDRRVCTCDQEKYRAVVEYAENLFRFEIRAETVVNARHTVKHYHHRAENSRAHNAVRVALFSCENYAQHRHGDTHCAADDMRHHIKNFLALRVIGYRYLILFYIFF